VDLELIAGIGTERVLPRVFDGVDLPADRDVLDLLERDLANTDLVAPPVVLPDFHHKSDMEMPSSIAVATSGTIRPTLTSASVNCGMALLALDMEPPTTAAVTRFFDAVRTRYPDPPGWRKELTRRDVEGAGFGVDRYGIEPSALERIEEDGRVDPEPWGGAAQMERDLPWLSWQAARMRFGTVGPSNHFVELQRVEEIFDPVAAERLGVSEGQLTLQYHAGGGLLTGQVGRLFVRRKKLSKPLRLEMAVQKPLFHLASARSLAQLRERFSLYFRDEAPGVDVETDEGRRLMLANVGAMNYGFAFRAATYANLASLVRELFGVKDLSLVVDSPHNSIYEEEVGGRRAIVHRHNSCRAYPADRMTPGTAFGDVGQAVLVPGLSTTSSYLCVAGASSERSLHSACHGAGTVIDMFKKDGRSDLDPRGRTTLRYRYDGAAPAVVPQLDDNGVNAALGILVDNALVSPVARMRPLAVLH
jgi:tRNA-splicing ligase RtcB